MNIVCFFSIEAVFNQSKRVQFAPGESFRVFLDNQIQQKSNLIKETNDHPCPILMSVSYSQQCKSHVIKVGHVIGIRGFTLRGYLVFGVFNSLGVVGPGSVRKFNLVTNNCIKLNKKYPKNIHSRDPTLKNEHSRVPPP